MLVLNDAFVSHSVISPIDGKSMEAISSTKMFQKSEYKENGKIIRWTEVQALTSVRVTGETPLTCGFGAGVLSAEAGPAQGRSE